MLRLEEKAHEIRKRRKLLNLTQKELAGRSGVSQSLIAKMESGKIEPSYSSVQKLDSALNDLEKINLKKETIAKEIMNTPLVWIKENEKLNKAIKIMWSRGFSQLPVMDGKASVGSISEEDVLRAHENYGKNLKDIEAKDVMNGSFPIVNENTKASSIRELLKENKAVLVTGGKKINGIITRSDFLRI